MLHAKDVHDIVYPAMLLDMNLVIVEKNAAARVKYSTFRCGSSIKHHIHSDDRERIMKLHRGESVQITLKSGSNLNAVVYKTNDYFILKISVLITEIVSRVSKILEYNENYLCECIALYKAMPDTKRFEYKLRKLLHIQSTINDYLRISKNIRSDVVSLNNLNQQLNDTITVAKGLLDDMHIACECDITDELLVFNYCAKDFELMLLGVISSMALLTSSDRIFLDCHTNGNYVTLKACTQSDDLKELKEILHNGSGDLLLLSERKGEIYYMLEYINRLCEYYEYKFAITFPPRKNLIQIAINMRFDKPRSADIHLREPAPYRVNVRLAEVFLAAAYEKHFNRLREKEEQL